MVTGLTPDDQSRLSAEIITVPTDLVFREANLNDKIINAVRECHANAGNYNATEAGVFTLWVEEEQESYLIYCHNGESFKDQHDILFLGCTPNVTEGHRSSFQGCGLLATAFALHRNPTLVVASWCKQGKHKAFCAGTATRDGQQLMRKDARKEWRKNLRRLLGNKIDSYSVFYLFKIKFPDTRSRSFLNRDMFSALELMSHGMTPNDMNFYFGAKQIGYPYKPIQIPAKRTAADYASLQLIAEQLGVDGQGGGYHHRKVCSADEYFERYLLDEGEHEIPCEPFWAQITPTLRVHVKQARVVVRVFPAKMIDGTMVNERTIYAPTTAPRIYRKPKANGKPANRKTVKKPLAAKGAASKYGSPPKHKSFLVVPWVSHANHEADNTSYSRFLTNSLATYQSPQLMERLGLDYCDMSVSRKPSKEAQPFATVHVYIDEVDDQIDSCYGTDDLSPCDPIGFMAALARRADFYFENRNGSQALMRGACDAARLSVPKKLKEICTDLFPPNAEEWIPIFLDRRMLDMSKKPDMKMSRDKNVWVLDLDNDAETFCDQWELGKSKRLAIFHYAQNRFISASEITEHPATRGIELADVTQVVSQFDGLREALSTAAELTRDNGDPLINADADGYPNPIPVVSIKVSPMVRIDDMGVTPIEPPEYQHNKDHLPSRNIRLSFQNESINLGVAPDVPVMEKKGGPPPKGPRQKPRTPVTKQVQQNTLTHRDPRVFCEWSNKANAGMLRLNAEHPWVIQYFKRPGAPDRLQKKTRNLYWALSYFAKRIVESCRNASMKVTNEQVLSIRDEENEELRLYNDDNWDYPLNFVLGQSTNDPLIQRLTRQLDKEWEKVEARKSGGVFELDEEEEEEEEEEEDDFEDFEVLALDPTQSR